MKTNPVHSIMHQKVSNVWWSGDWSKDGEFVTSTHLCIEFENGTRIMITPDQGGMLKICRDE